MFVPGEYHPPPSPPTPGKEESVPPRRGSDGKLRGRKRVSDPAPPLDSDIEVNTRLTLRGETSILNRPICLGGVNITHLLFHCRGCLSGIWMKPSSFSTRSSREPSLHASERYATLITRRLATNCRGNSPELLVSRRPGCLFNGVKFSSSYWAAGLIL